MRVLEVVIYVAVLVLVMLVTSITIGRLKPSERALRLATIISASIAAVAAIVYFLLNG
jgi:hypothetical protein